MQPSYPRAFGQLAAARKRRKPKKGMGYNVIYVLSFSVFSLADFRAAPQITEHLEETFPVYAARHRLTLQRNEVNFWKHSIDQKEQSTR